MSKISRRKALTQITGGIFTGGFLTADVLTGYDISQVGIGEVFRSIKNVLFNDESSIFEEDSIGAELHEKLPELAIQTIKDIQEDYDRYNEDLVSIVASLESGLFAYGVAGGDYSLSKRALYATIIGKASGIGVNALDKKPSVQEFQAKYNLNSYIAEKVREIVVANIKDQYKSSVPQGAIYGGLAGPLVYSALDKSIPDPS